MPRGPRRGSAASSSRRSPRRSLLPAPPATAAGPVARRRAAGRPGPPARRAAHGRPCRAELSFARPDIAAVQPGDCVVQAQRVVAAGRHQYSSRRVNPASYKRPSGVVGAVMGSSTQRTPFEVVANRAGRSGAGARRAGPAEPRARSPVDRRRGRRPPRAASAGARAPAVTRGVHALDPPQASRPGVHGPVPVLSPAAGAAAQDRTPESPRQQGFREGERRDSNPRPPGPQPGALPTELRPPRCRPVGRRSESSSGFGGVGRLTTARKVRMSRGETRSGPDRRCSARGHGGRPGWCGTAARGSCGGRHLREGDEAAQGLQARDEGREEALLPHPPRQEGPRSASSSSRRPSSPG